MSKNTSKPPAVVFPPEAITPEPLTTSASPLPNQELAGIPSGFIFNEKDKKSPLKASWATAPEGQEFRHNLVELQQKFEELREENQLKANFVNAVVHDIKSPLTVILGVLDMIHQDLNSERKIDNQYYQQLFSDAIQSCQEITNLINDMLDLSKMNKETLQELNLEPCSVSDVLDAAMAVARGFARQARVQLVSSVQNDLPDILVDRKQIHRAIMNLVSNAVKFTPPGGTVELRAGFLNEKRSDALCDYVLISVSDTGEGLSPSESPYVFDAYWQAENGKRKCGTGLGLAIVKRIAVAHGGNVSVRSQLQKGSTFTIMIPVNGSPAVSLK